MEDNDDYGINNDHDNDPDGEGGITIEQRTRTLLHKFIYILLGLGNF